MAMELLMTHATRKLALPTLLALSITGCASSKPDPRSNIIAPNSSYRARLAKSVNGSRLWKAYFDELAPQAEGARPLVEIRLQMERVVTHRSSGGDYDPGKVEIRFESVHLGSGRLLYRENKEKHLDSFMIGLFDENATREDIQRIAFEAAEDDVFPFIDRWVNISAIRAMAQEGPRGAVFLDLLQEQSEDPWAEDLVSEARHALTSIRGGN